MPKFGAVLAAQGVPYRMDELNSCYNGGAKGSSDTYASTLWALDCTHWWAAHHILGMNYHTGESLGRAGGNGGTNFAVAGGVPIAGVNVAPNYAAFVHQADGHGMAMRLQAYAYLAFTRGAHGRPLGIEVQADPALNFNAYAYRDVDGSIYVTLINKSYGDNAQSASVSIKLPQGVVTEAWQQMDLKQKHQDIAARQDVMLGGVSVTPEGNWLGQWSKIRSRHSGSITVKVAPASATILRIVSGK